jgi:hypothetical protein
VLAVSALYTCHRMATFKAGPEDRAAHGMVPADLQINLIGLLLEAVSGTMAAAYLALLVTLALGVADAIYFALFPAIFGMSLLVAGFGAGWFRGATFISSALVICSAATHWFRSRERSKPV